MTVIDLTGRSTPWPAAASGLWRECAAYFGIPAAGAAWSGAAESQATGSVAAGADGRLGWASRSAGGPEQLRKATAGPRSATPGNRANQTNAAAPGADHRPARPQGDAALRAGLGRELALDPRGLVVTGGVRSLAAVIGSPGLHWLVERPTFAEIPAILLARGLRVEQADWAELLRAGPGRLAFWVTSPARNPDGAGLSGPAIDTLASLAAAGCLVVQNETYRWHAEPLRIPGAVLVGSLSKLLGPGTRTGWAWHSTWDGVAPGPLLPAVAPPLPWQRTLAAFIAAGGLRDLRDHAVRTVREARDAFLGALGNLPSSTPVSAPVSTANATEPPTGSHPEAVAHCAGQAGPSVLLTVPAGADPAKLQASLAAHGVLVGLGADFDAPYPSLRACFTGVTATESARAAKLIGAELRAAAVIARAS